MVERRVVGFLAFRRDPVVLGDLAVHAEEDRLSFNGQVGPAELAFYRLHPDL
jgi:hypothetical protein